MRDAANTYLASLGRVPLLHPRDEAALATELQGAICEVAEIIARSPTLRREARVSGLDPRLVARDDEALRRMCSLLRARVEGRQAERDAQSRLQELERARKRLQVARRRLVEANQRLVVHIARRYLNRGLPLMDLVQEGNLGLLAAIDRFDPERGFKLSTYATWWIRQSMERGLACQARTIRMPVHAVESLKRVARMRQHLVNKLGREPTAEEVIGPLRMPERESQRLARAALRPRSLDAPVGQESETTLGALVADSAASGADEVAAQRITGERARSLLGDLRPREAEVLRQRFGIDREARTLEEIGADLDLTRERIRQIEKAALTKLRRSTRARALADEDDRSADPAPPSRLQR